QQVLAVVVSTRSLDQDRALIPCSRAKETTVSTDIMKKVASERGFGFIEAADGKEYFFHRRGMDASVNFDSLMGSEKVIFEIEPSPKDRALNASAWRSYVSSGSACRATHGWKRWTQWRLRSSQPSSATSSAMRAIISDS